MSMLQAFLVAVCPNVVFFFLPHWVKGIPHYIAKIACGGAVILFLIGISPMDQKFLFPAVLIIMGVISIITGGALLYSRTKDAGATEQAASTPTTMPASEVIKEIEPKPLKAGAEQSLHHHVKKSAVAPVEAPPITPPTVEAPSGNVPGNSIRDITSNEGIVTQGQTGDNNNGAPK